MVVSRRTVLDMQSAQLNMTASNLPAVGLITYLYFPPLACPAPGPGLGMFLDRSMSWFPHTCRGGWIR
jgi:hypothetical protein